MVANLPNVPQLEDFTDPARKLTRMAAQWLQRMLDTVNRLNSRVISGSGSPETVVTAPVGTLYLRQDGGASTTLYIKESGSGNTGWIAK